MIVYHSQLDHHNNNEEKQRGSKVHCGIVAENGIVAEKQQ